MSWKKEQLSLGLLSVLLLLAHADNSVHILSKYGQLVTSSTLNWLPRSHYEATKEIVIGGYEVTATADEDNNQAERAESTKPLYVCRALHNGVWVAGSQRHKEERCTVSIHGNVHSYERYDLLENMENAGRLCWQHWDKYVELPVGSVATDKMYVARHKAVDEEHSNHVPRYTHYIGTITSNDNFGTIFYVTDNGTEVTAKSGDILVESEPIYYKLVDVKLNWKKKRVSKRTPRILGTATLKNDNMEGATVAEAFAYSYTYSMYWGQGHAVLKGLNTSVTLFNGTTLPDIIWGTKERKNRTDVRTVEIYLKPGTAVNVTLKANYTDMDVPYVGELVAHYEDGDKRPRKITGIRQEETLVDITPEFGHIYFLSNYTLVPTTTTPIPMTTQMTTTTKEPLHSEEKETRKSKIDHQQEIDENRIIPPMSSDTSNMLRDDDSPLSLKNKIESANSGVLSRFQSVESLILPFIAIVLRRIAA